ncbi:MAG: hypothetical protein AAFS10_11225, partial [Myxococcota bacterium]
RRLRQCVLSSQLGVTDIGGQGCAPCQRDPEQFGAPCGSQCLGDELYTQTDHVSPHNSSGRWILRAPYRQVTYGRPDSTLHTETLSYYDEGDVPLEGMALGSLDQGKLTRVTHKLYPDQQTRITSVRNRYDAHGNVIETLDANGHRRQYHYDTDKLRVIRADILLEDNQGDPYRLRREMRYEPVFDKVVESTAWMRVVQDQVLSSRRSTSYSYDGFGRLSSMVKPGQDSANAPTKEVQYALGNPTSRIITRSRSAPGEPHDIEQIACIDGKGRTYQTRTRLEEGRYQVNGFTRFNVRGSEQRIYQPYTSPSDACDTAPPPGTRFTRFIRDGDYRTVQTIAPDSTLYGTASVAKTVYRPLATVIYDHEDTDETSTHINTPSVTRVDGLGRTTSIERMLEPEGDPAVVAMHYDGLGRLTGYTDPGGHRKVQHYDLLGRVLRVEDPNSEGDNLYQYDPVGNTIAFTDGRGMTTQSRYDGANRLIATWDKDRPTDSLIRWHYDHASGCAAEMCSNSEGLLAQVSYPGLDGERSIDTVGYDLRGRPRLKTRLLSGYTFRFEMEYDNADRPVATTYPNGHTIMRTYDDAGRLKAIDGVVDSIAYSARGLMTTMQRSDGTTQTWEHDPLMRLEQSLVTTRQGELLQGMAYTRDRTGNILTIEDLTNPDGQSPRFGAAFVYDAWYRPVIANYERMHGHMETVHYQYDTLDNILSRTSSMGADSKAHIGAITYDGWGPHAVSKTSSKTFGYDPAGNMTTQGQRMFQWDYQGRLTAVQNDDGHHLAQMTYGSHEERIATRDKHGSTALYPSADFEVHDGISALYVRIGRTRLARIQGDALSTDLLPDLAPLNRLPDGQINAGDAWVAQVQNTPHAHEGTQSASVESLLMSSARRIMTENSSSKTHLYHDHLGSLTLATAQGHVKGKRNFYHHGHTINHVDHVDTHGFTGQKHETFINILKFKFRYYDHHLGRWLSTDPLFSIINTDKI